MAIDKHIKRHLRANRWYTLLYKLFKVESLINKAVKHLNAAVIIGRQDAGGHELFVYSGRLTKAEHRYIHNVHGLVIYRALP